MSAERETCPTCHRAHELARVCKDCQNTFSIPFEEQIRFERLGFEYPRRCPACRALRRQQREALAHA